jgi:hypothetical protein
MAMDRPTLQQFTVLLGQRFELRGDSAGHWAADLVEASQTEGQAFQGRQPFTLMFRGPTQPVLPQSTYRVSSPHLPAMDIFLVPVSAAADGVRYEAVFG